jgi:SAM-dependent methyltransferase
MNPMHESNRRGWDAVSPFWQANLDLKKDWRRCPHDPRLALRDEELLLLGAVSGRTVCVAGSGDNMVVFALAGLGARVTSVDLSQVQLDIAEHRAGQLGLDIVFVRADVTDLRALADNTFDIVYTGGHVAVWVSDLNRYYAEAGRILKPGGIFLVHEYHPFRRLWRHAPGPLEQEFRYGDRGPFTYDRSELVPGAAPGSLPSYEFHWTVGDYVSAFLNAGCELLSLQEPGDQRQDWEQDAPLEGLPESLILAGRKRDKREMV